MNYKFLIAEHFETHCILKFNRPEKKNALNKVMRQELMEFLDKTDGTVNAIVLTGSGDSFCSGLDLSEKPGPQGAVEIWDIAHRIFNAKSTFIAAVNGFARGGGVTLTNACDIALASPQATFGMPEISYGFYAAVAGPTTQMILPKKIVSRMLLTAEPIDAEEAARVFLINEVAEADQLVESASAIAKKMSTFDPDAVAICKRALNTLPFADEDRQTAQALAQCLKKEHSGSESRN